MIVSQGFKASSNLPHPQQLHTHKKKKTLFQKYYKDFIDFYQQFNTKKIILERNPVKQKEIKSDYMEHEKIIFKRNYYKHQW